MCKRAGFAISKADLNFSEVDVSASCTCKTVVTMRSAMEGFQRFAAKDF